MPPSPYTVTKKHQWTEVTIVPVEVLGLDQEGLPVVVPLKEAEPHIGCSECLDVLQPDNLDAECAGDTDAPQT